MDPANFASHMLPRIEYTQLEAPYSYYVKLDVGYDEFIEKFLEFVSEDCHAISVDDEIIYNSYESKSIRDTILDTIILHKIIDDPNSLFTPFFKKNKGKVILYMMGNTPWFVAIYYKDNFITVETYKSTKYEEMFENNRT